MAAKISLKDPELADLTTLNDNRVDKEKAEVENLPPKKEISLEEGLAG